MKINKESLIDWFVTDDKGILAAHIMKQSSGIYTVSVLYAWGKGYEDFRCMSFAEAKKIAYNLDNDD